MSKKILLFLLLLPSTLWAQATMSEARSEIRDKLAEEEADYFTDVEIDTAWNRAQRLMGLYANITIANRDSVTTVSGTSFYALNSSLYKLRAVFKGTGINQTILPVISNVQNLTLVGTVTPSEYAILHGTTLFLYPMPTNAQKIYYMYYAQPSLLTSSSAATQLPPIIHQAPIWEAASILIPKDHKQDLSDKFHERAKEIVDMYKSSNMNQIVVEEK